MVLIYTMFDKEHNTYTESSPNYGLSSDLAKSIAVACLLLGGNILLMVYLTDTVLSEVALLLFKYAIVGVIVFGILLTAGRELSLRGLDRDNNIMAFVGTAILLGTYGVFGAMILSRFPKEIWSTSINVTLIVVLIITAIATIYVTRTDRDLSHLVKYSSFAFIAGILAAFIGTFITPVLLIAFVLFIIGFLIDLVWEIWMATNKNRSPVANGVAIYVAMAGLFVHILQIVLEYYAANQ